MATFYNQATLTYNGIRVASNTTTGQILEILALTKTALSAEYSAGEDVTYVISLVNSGGSALSGLTVTDDLGAYAFGTGTVTPLTYKTGTLQYYVNGVLQPVPEITAEDPLTITGINVPANGNALLVYEAAANQFAPLALESTIVNRAAASGAGLAEEVADTETIGAAAGPVLSINKALAPTSVAENGRITYTFTLENYGNAPADAGDNAVITDTFTPVLEDITVTFNGEAWTEPANYTYDEATGLFTTAEGQITVPAAIYAQDTATGAWIVTPGISTLTVTGTI
ncbi:MAG: hypothetical protein E7223_01670 [Clostridiales bacterium]|nr:hypothetical protein [Clostridiales bacterium]